MPNSCRLIVVTFCVGIRSSASRPAKLRRINPAPTSSTIASQTSAATSVDVARRAFAPKHEPRDALRTPTAFSERTVSAATSPNTSVVSAMIPSVNASTLPLMRTSLDPGTLPDCGGGATSACAPQYAIGTPPAPATTRENETLGAQLRGEPSAAGT